MMRWAILAAAGLGLISLAACDIPPDHNVDVSADGRSYDDPDTGSLLGGKVIDNGVSAPSTTSFGGHQPADSTRGGG